MKDNRIQLIKGDKLKDDEKKKGITLNKTKPKQSCLQNICKVQFPILLFIRSRRGIIRPLLKKGHNLQRKQQNNGHIERVASE